MPNQYIPTSPEIQLQAFWDKVDKSPHPQGCWVWTAAKDKDGYGIGYWKAKVTKAHRISYEIANGRAPGKSSVLHSCDNPSCVNPSHLRLGTVLDNNVDRARKCRSFHPTGEKHPMCRLTDVQIVEIRMRHAGGGETYQHLADDYGVSCTHIYRIVKRLRRT